MENYPEEKASIVGQQKEMNCHLDNCRTSENLHPSSEDLMASYGLQLVSGRGGTDLGISPFKL